MHKHGSICGAAKKLGLYWVRLGIRRKFVEKSPRLGAFSIKQRSSKNLNTEIKKHFIAQFFILGKVNIFWKRANLH